MNAASVTKHLLLSALGLTFAVAPASAQETGRIIQRKAAQVDRRGPDGARKTMEDFAACLVARSPGRVENLAPMRVDSDAYQKAMRVLFERSNDECLSDGGLSFNLVMFRGALFQALYARTFKAKGPVAFDPAVVSGYRALYPAEVSAEARSSIAMTGFGECVARADGASARALIGALPGSDVETQSFAALNPRFAACIPQGEQIAFSKAILKGVVAEGLYRLSVAAQSKSVVK